MDDPSNSGIGTFENRPLARKSACLVILFALGGLLVAIDYFLGRRVLYFSAGFAALWFTISFVLLSRPPAMPEIQAERGGVRRLILRRDILPIVPVAERLNLSLTVACGACLLLWITLGGLGR